VAQTGTSAGEGAYDRSVGPREVATVRELMVELLGPPRVAVGRAPLVVDTRKAVAVLALVAVGGEQPRETLASMLWPDGDPAHARGALRRTLSVLNAALGPQHALQAQRGAVVLQDAGARVDVHRFEELAASTGAHGHRLGAVCDDCIPALTEAVELCRGEFLAGFVLRDAPDFDAWRATQAERLRRELTRALDRLTRASAEAGDLDAAAQHLDRWLELDPLNEQAVGRTMMLHAWRGERSEAVRRYRECAALLARDLGVAPLPQTTRLYEAILGGRVVARPEPVATSAIP
jgi:DNA-binding SARP family transcriptional activator